MMEKFKKALFTPKFSIRNVILSLILGFLVAYLTIIIIYGFSDASYVVKSIFKGDFYDSKSVARLFDKIVILGFAGLAVLVGNKAGLLNIGVSGQMVFGAFVGYFIVRKMNTDNITAILIVGFISTVLTSTFVAMISGIMKAFFKVNEVISTIMVNWIVVYLIKFLASYSKTNWYNSSSINTISLSQPSNTSTSFAHQIVTEGVWNAWYLAIIGIVLFVVSAGVLWFLFAKTRYGFKVQSVGLSKQASQYSGYNTKLHQIFGMSLSGAFAGMAGFTMYFLSKNVIAASSAPINEGFAGIAVALVALNNPLAILGSAFVFGILDGPTDGIVFGGFPSSMVQIFAGVMTYFVAITTLWIYLRPVVIFKNVQNKWFKKENNNKEVIS
ncbi:MAG: ABC transporter permease [Mycoplasmatales bacterium]|nr:ABC transporter permease [Mycoplasmatales bacterium]